MVKVLFNLTGAQMLKSWTVMDTIISVVSLILILLLNSIV
ncbi:hypothetical protein J7E95_05315 [Streptomyces sp. ISL-14]|nr:hypothetical protein [Bacillus sp. ISL-4]MBT2670226.1 hypothetical protein [Streptomyces sp. ISL-14]